MNKVGVGVIGCGVISGAYLKAAKGFPILDIRGLADLVRRYLRDQRFQRIRKSIISFQYSRRSYAIPE